MGSVEPDPEDSSPPVPEEDIPQQPDHNTTAEPESRNPETRKSGRTSGNPENKKSGNTESGANDEPDDYLTEVYGGTTDPDDDYQKFSTQLPLYLQKALKAAAPTEQVNVQELLADIVRGKRPPLPKSHPKIVMKFRKLAERGDLKR